MEPSIYILAFSTSNYDAMKKFFVDFGFIVDEDPDDQLTPFFEHGRASNISRGGFEFQLEESSSGAAKACFNLYLPDYTSEEIERLKSLGYEYECQVFFEESHSFRSPDGGIITCK
jgi:catechol 2,3-dioxygenase-like lactoylglutathione lyase family enzyme